MGKVPDARELGDLRLEVVASRSLSDEFLVGRCDHAVKRVCRKLRLRVTPRLVSAIERRGERRANSRLRDSA